MLKILFKLKSCDLFLKVFPIKQQIWLLGFVITAIPSSFSISQVLVNVISTTYTSTMITVYSKKTSFNSFEICFSLQQLPWRMRVRTKQKMENETRITYHLVEAPAPLANNRSIKISTDYVVVVISIQRQLVN